MGAQYLNIYGLDYDLRFLSRNSTDLRGGIPNLDQCKQDQHLALSPDTMRLILVSHLMLYKSGVASTPDLHQA